MSAMSAMSAQSSVNSRSRASSYVVLVRITSTNVSGQPTFANSFCIVSCVFDRSVG